MSLTLKKMVTAAALAAMAAPVAAQSVIESYRAQIDPVDRRNSSGVALTDLGAILAQDRANLHRFGRGQAGDTVDGIFVDGNMRAAMPGLLSRGSITPDAERALRSGAAAALQVTVWGRPGAVSHVTVALAGAGSTQPSEPPISAAELAREARTIQAALNARGFDAGPVDGQPGQRTRAAIAAFQASIGTAPTGVLTKSDFAALIGAAGAAAGQQTPAAGEAAAETSESGAGPASGSAVAASEVSQEDGLIYLDGGLLWSAASSNVLSLPQGAEALAAHEELLARRLVYTSWAAASDDLGAGLSAAPGPQFLRRMFDLLPDAARDEVATFALELTNAESDRADWCNRQSRSALFSCVTQGLETEFDRRRMQRGVAEIIARVAETEKFDLPLRLQIVCTLGRIDSFYDFDASTVNWAGMIGAGACRNANAPVSYLNESPLDLDLDLAAAVPETTVMAPEQVERYARAHQRQDELGEWRQNPLILTFGGQIDVARTGTAEGDPRGLAPVRFTVTRTGPVSLRQASAPTQVILRFEPPSNELAPTAGVDLSQAGQAFRLVESAREVDGGALTEAVAVAGANAGGQVVLLPAYPQIGEDEDGVARLGVGNFFLPEEPAQRVAAMTGQPLPHVGWTQLISNERGVPNTELVLVFPAPYAALASQPIDAETAEAARRGNTAFLLARISAPMRMEGAAGPALVSAVTPLTYEVHERGIGGATRVVARPPLAEVAAAPQQQVFLPSPWWFAFKGAELSGADLDTHLNAVLDRANLHSGDTFARIDAIAEARAVLDRMDADGRKDPWIAGRVSLGPYDLERRAWPLRGLTLAMPTMDRTEAAIARRVMPEIETSGLFLPMPMEEARAFQEAHGQQHLELYARIDVSAPRPGRGLNVQGHLREVLLFPMTGSRSQPMQVSPAFDPGQAIAAFDLPAPDDALPAAAVATAPTAPATQPDPAPAPAAPATMSMAPTAPSATSPDESPGGDAVAQSPWPEVPDVDVAQGTWDVLGLRTGMSLRDAEEVLRQRGPLLAAIERPREEIDPAKVQALMYQRIYVMGDGTEAITLAGPGPDGPVLAIMRRLQLPRGALPFEAIRGALEQKYGAPSMRDPSGDAMAKMFWISGAPGPRQAICRAHLPARIDGAGWPRLPGIGDPAFDLTTRPAAWNWAIIDFPVDYAEQLTDCAQILTYAPESEARGGGGAFSMLLLDAAALLEMDEALAGVPDAGALEIDF